MARLLYFVLLVLVFCASVIEGDSDVPFFRRDYKFLDSTKAYYKYHSTVMPWEEAKKKCESESAVLYYPENELEVKEVKTLYRENTWTWLGAKRQDGEDGEDGSFEKTVDGRMVNDSYVKWSVTEPNNVFKVEDCVVLLDDSNNYLNDYHCNALLSFVCKKRLEDVANGLDIIAEEEETDCHKESLVGLRNFYELHKEPKTWEEAQEVCRNSSSTLFFPENQIEAGKVAGLTNDTYWTVWIWVGASQSNYPNSTDFTTDNGNSINESYHNWYPIEPRKVGIDRNCATFCPDGNIKSDDCKATHMFICKTSVFVSPIKHQKSRPSSGDIVSSSLPQVGAINPQTNQSHYVTELVQSLARDPLPENCLQETECKGTCRTIDNKSKSHVYFGNVVSEEIQRFPVGKKLTTMHAVMKVIREMWRDAVNECALQGN